LPQFYMTINKITHIQPQTGASSSTATIIEGSVTAGADVVLLISDMTVREILEQILIELKIMNLRQEAVTGEIVNYKDVK